MASHKPQIVLPEEEYLEVIVYSSCNYMNNCKCIYLFIIFFFYILYFKHSNNFSDNCKIGHREFSTKKFIYLERIKIKQLFL